MLETPSSYKDDHNANIENLHTITETKQQTGRVLDELNKIEKEEGMEIQEIKVGDQQISKTELILKELVLKGNECFYKKQYNEAIDCYDKALMINPDDVSALNNKGTVLYSLGKHNEAIDCYDKALMINPNYPDISKAKKPLQKYLKKTVIIFYI